MNNNFIRATYDNQCITVYQAFGKTIATSAVNDQKFTSPSFKIDRMTWIKPSFLWMMYRSGWATKENQENILAIKISREGFEWALNNACLTRFDNSIFNSYAEWKDSLSKSPVRIQWDPEKNIFLESLNLGSIQIGLSGLAVTKYISEWIIQIDDITEYSKQINLLLEGKKTDQATEMLPIEKIYPLPEHIGRKIKLSDSTF